MRPTDTAPAPVLRSDYASPAWQVETVDLRFELDPGATLVTTRLGLVRAGNDDAPLVLNGEELVLEGITVDGVELAQDRYEVEHETLVVHGLPSR